MKIAQLGTFDVPNYGDLLFPQIAAKRLRRYADATLEPVSPVGGLPVWADSPRSISSKTFFARRPEYDGIIVGGGNIIRLTPSDLKNYNKDLTPLLSYADLWLGAIVENEVSSTPVCWNAPGVPGPLPSSMRPFLRSCLERVAYLSVRDEVSRQFLQEISDDLEIAVVPDSAWEIDKLWTHRQLSAAYKNAFASRRKTLPERSVTVHVNSRYLADSTAKQIAASLDQLCEELDAIAILIAIGPCHGDDEMAEAVATSMTTGPLLVNQPASLEEVTAAIAGSIAYIGSSMHGFIAASSFGKPAVIVASPSTVKFPGLLAQIGLPDLLHETWGEAIDHLGCLLTPYHVNLLQQIRETQQQRLDRHWSNVAGVLVDRAIKERVSITQGAPLSRYPEILLGVTAMDLWRQKLATQAREKEREERRNRTQRELTKRLQVQKARAEELARQLEAAKRKVEALLASTSWRVTGPLRRISLNAQWLRRNLRRAAKLAKLL